MRSRTSQLILADALIYCYQQYTKFISKTMIIRCLRAWEIATGYKLGFDINEINNIKKLSPDDKYIVLSNPINIKDINNDVETIIYRVKKNIMHFIIQLHKTDFTGFHVQNHNELSIAHTGYNFRELIAILIWLYGAGSFHIHKIFDSRIPDIINQIEPVYELYSEIEHGQSTIEDDRNLNIIFIKLFKMKIDIKEKNKKIITSLYNIYLEDTDKNINEINKDIELCEEELKKIPEEKTNKNLCRICYTKELSILLECNHVVCCTECIQKINPKVCPLCREEFESYKKIYF